MLSMIIESSHRSTVLSIFLIIVDQIEVGFCHVATDRADALSQHSCSRVTNPVSRSAVGSMAWPGPTATVGYSRFH